jgi:hypothetical protein
MKIIIKIIIIMKIMKPTTHHVRENEKHETKRKNNTKAACNEIRTLYNHYY